MSDFRPEQENDRNKKNDGSAESRRVKKRIAIAAALVAVAVAAIPLLNILNKNKQEVAEGNPQASSGKIQSASGAAASTPAATVPASAPQASSEAAHTAPPPGLPGSPATEKTPAVASGFATAPGTQPTIHAAVPSKPAAEPAPSPAQPPVSTPPAPHKTQAAPAVAPTPAPQVPRSTPKAAPTPVQPAAPVEVAQPAEVPKAKSGSFGYNVQLGLFSNLENAQKFVTMLKSQGIAVKTETRVHVGPFRSRAEAEETMSKLKSLGYQPLLQPAGQ